VFDLVAKLENLDWEASVKKVAEIMSIDIADMTITVRSKSWQQDTKKWIENMKKMFNRKSIKPFSMKVFPNLYPITSYRNFNEDTLNYFGIKYCDFAELPRKDKSALAVKDRIVVPIYQETALLGVTLRRTDNSPIKWMHQPEGINTGEFLYNIDNCKSSDTDYIIVTEGCGDVWNCTQNDYPNAVACFGSHLTEQQEKMLLRNTYNVLLSYDSDDAGIIATCKAIVKLQNKVNVKIARIPLHKDPGILNKEEMDLAYQNPISINEWKSNHKQEMVKWK